MSFNGDNIAFVFFKTQIQKLMNQCLIIERRLEVLRAACVDQPGGNGQFVFWADARSVDI